ncbi:MAG: NAD-dependent epimerase/dehydratase family protein [Umezawaea sp.]
MFSSSTHFNALGESPRVLITGGSGFIGSALAARLAARGVAVTVFDRQAADVPPAGVAVVDGDVRDLDRCVELVSVLRPDFVFHLAASSTIDSAYKEPYESLRTNVVGTLNILEAVRRVGGVRRFVLASTDKVYGELQGHAYQEESPREARGVYDVGKLAADELTQLYGSELGVPITVLRLCNVFGPGDSNTDYRLVPRSVDRLLDVDGPRPPTVYAASMLHGRDYVYVDDVVRALLAVATDARTVSQVLNMAPAAHRTTLVLVEELISVAVEIYDSVDPRRSALIRANGVEIVDVGGPATALQRQHCDGSRLRSLGFRPVVGLREGLRRTVLAAVRDTADNRLRRTPEAAGNSVVEPAS